MVLDLQIEPGKVSALVQGSHKTPYSISITIDKMSASKWNSIVAQCCRKIDGIAALVDGKFPEELAQIFLQQGTGLFPSPKEIHFECSCPDWAYMCKHVAAVLYGVGAKLDGDPKLFFTLRDIDFSVLIKKSIEEKMANMLKNAGKKSKRIIDDANIAGLFGIETSYRAQE
jgi:uncharacterized Zn finger protein